MKAKNSTPPRVYCPDIKDEITLEEEEFHYLIHVLRKPVGALIEIVDGKGGLAKAKIKEITKKGATVEISEKSFTPREQKKFILAQGFLRQSRLDWVLEKSVELGVFAIYLFPAEKSISDKLSEKNEERLQKEAISALKQSKTLYLPEIVIMPPLKEWTKPLGALFFGSLDPVSPHLLDLEHPWKTAIAFIGPESGFSEKELEILKFWQAASVKLHTNVLRAETAALAAATFFSYLSKE